MTLRECDAAPAPVLRVGRLAHLWGPPPVKGAHGNANHADATRTENNAHQTHHFLCDVKKKERPGFELGLLMVMPSTSTTNAEL